MLSHIGSEANVKVTGDLRRSRRGGRSPRGVRVERHFKSHRAYQVRVLITEYVNRSHATDPSQSQERQCDRRFLQERRLRLSDS